MVCSFQDLRCKEVINIKTGARVGFVDDIEFETCTAKILTIIVFGRGKFFGLFGRLDDIVIKWCDIEVIGEDTILVNCDEPRKRVKKGGFLENLLS